MKGSAVVQDGLRALHDELGDAKNAACLDQVYGNEMVGLVHEIVLGRIVVHEGRGAVNSVQAASGRGPDSLKRIRASVGDCATPQVPEFCSLLNGRGHGLDSIAGFDQGRDDVAAEVTEAAEDEDMGLS